MSIKTLQNSALFCHCFGLTAGIVPVPGWNSPLSRISNIFCALIWKEAASLPYGCETVPMGTLGECGRLGGVMTPEEVLLHTPSRRHSACRRLNVVKPGSAKSAPHHCQSLLPARAFSAHLCALACLEQGLKTGTIFPGSKGFRNTSA